MRLIVGNGHSKLYDASPRLVKKLRKLTSYRIKGYQFAPSYHNNAWDGYVKLLRMTADRSLRFPTGLLSDVLKVIENVGLEPPEIQDKRRFVGIGIELPWLADDIVPRDYQLEAVALATKGDRTMAGRGILKLPIRSGKTVIAAMLIHRWGLRAVFVATSQLILAQTYALFTRIFGEGIGLIGDKSFAPGFITVASIQRLQRLDDPVKKLLKLADVLIVDEVHHMRGDSWREPILRADARYKIGLSATVTVNRKLCERSAVWLKSAAGPILIDVPMKRLVDGGYILAPDIILAELDGGDIWERAPWDKAYDQLIVRNGDRNRLIVEAAGMFVRYNHRVLIDTGRLDHIKRLFSESKRNGLDSAIIYGNLSAAKRAEALSDFVNGRKPVLIGTVMGEGVDVPILSAVINAEGGKDPGATIQRMRNLTVHPDKNQAITIDFIDNGNRYLADHSQIRLKQYHSEPAFNVIGPVIANNFLKELQATISER